MYLACEISLIHLGKRSADCMWNKSVSLGHSTSSVPHSYIMQWESATVCGLPLML